MATMQRAEARRPRITIGNDRARTKRNDVVGGARLAGGTAEGGRFRGLAFVRKQTACHALRAVP
jgi:hypothetical protein